MALGWQSQADTVSNRPKIYHKYIVFRSPALFYYNACEKFKMIRAEDIYVPHQQHYLTCCNKSQTLDSDDDFRSGCRNVSHPYRQQSFSGLHSPGRSNNTITCYPRVQTIYCITPITNYPKDYECQVW